MKEHRTEQCPACNYVSITHTKSVGDRITCIKCGSQVTVTEPLNVGLLNAAAKHTTKVTNDPVNHPPHYKAHPSGIECIQITEHMDFLKGNAIKYIWRAGSKGSEIEDLEKAKWYLERRITMLRERPAAMYP